MAERHSPGPWRAGTGSEASLILAPGENDGPSRVVCEVRYHPWDRPRQFADERLIAAAPTLLEAVKTAIDYFCSAAGTEEETVSALWEAYKAAAGEVNQ